MVKKNEKGAVLLIMLIVGIVIIAALYLFSLSKTAEENKQITPANSNSTDTPAEKAQDAIDSTQQYKDKADAVQEQLENSGQ